MPDNCTFLIYVAADQENVSGASQTKDEVLEAHLPQGVRVVMQVDRANQHTWRFVRDDQGLKRICLEDNVNSGRRKTLRGFLEWGIEECPSRNTCLTVWSHGNGALDPTRPTPFRKAASAAQRVRGDAPFNDPLTNSELRKVLENFGAAHGRKIDVVAFHSCLMGTVEVAFELSGVCRYLVAAEDEAKQTPWPYPEIFKDVGNAAEIAHSIVGKFAEQSAPGVLAAFDQSKVLELASAIGALGAFLCRMLESPKHHATIKAALDSARESMVELGDCSYVDLASALDQLAHALPSDDVRSAVAKAKVALDEVIIRRASVGQVHAELPGLSIFFPRPERRAAGWLSEYGKLQMSLSHRGWSEFLNALL
jgi:hypothetical protein